MLDKTEVQKQEEDIRVKVQKLSSDNKKEFYTKAEKEIKDPDTYAVLNWLFLTGLHHFYLKKWLRGGINILLFTLGIILLFTENIYFGIGIGIIAAVFIIELNELFQSQIIVQDYNNKISKKLINEILHENVDKSDNE